MNADEVHAHLNALPAAEAWAWLYGQPPEVQEAALRNMVALAAGRAGHGPDAAWAVALERVPMDAGYPLFRGVDPDREWADRLAAVSDRPVEGSVQGWHTDVSGEMSSQVEMTACLRAGASSNAHLASYAVAAFRPPDCGLPEMTKASALVGHRRE